jgi:hypothetical protein
MCCIGLQFWLSAECLNLSAYKIYVFLFCCPISECFYAVWNFIGVSVSEVLKLFYSLGTLVYFIAVFPFVRNVVVSYITSYAEGS